MNSAAAPPDYSLRRALVLGVLCLGLLTLVWRVVELQVLNKQFLQSEGNARHLRVVPIAAHRGMIVDRNGEPLAISTPVDSIWANPKLLINARERWPELGALLNMDVNAYLAPRLKRGFVYLKRRLDPALATRIMALKLPGVSVQREYRRYYPTGEVSAHVLGFTNIDDAGQEGLELAYDDWLRGIPGSKRVLKNRLGQTVEDVESISLPRPGQTLQLSLDRRIQYLAYRELKAAVLKHGARAASAVMLDIATGEIIAMVNLPAYNPNKIKTSDGGQSRNRAVTDLFEPGSTSKPFTVAAGLESGLFRPDTFIDTAPGTFRVGRKLIRDIHDYGRIDVSTIIQKSSNVGATKIALAIEPQGLWNILSGVGFGAASTSGFPGEASGSLPPYQRWHALQRAILSFGYGLSVTPLQLTAAYAALGNGGRTRAVTFLHVDHAPDAKPIMKEATATALVAMLERVTQPGGTATQARVAGYRVAGKTGTVHKVGAAGYQQKNYLSLFAGFVPATRPRLAMTILIDDPQGAYYGGLVAAPVFSKIMTDALRLLDIPPDDLPSLQLALDARVDASSVSTDAGAAEP